MDEDAQLAAAIEASLRDGGGASSPPSSSSSSASSSSSSSAPPLARESSLEHDIRELYGEQKVVREFDVYHVNGLEDAGGREAACVRVRIRQTESGLVTELATAEVGNSSDARAFESVVRTKWPGAMISYPTGVAPKLN